MRLSSDQENDSALTNDMVPAVRKRWSPGASSRGMDGSCSNFSRDVDRWWSVAALMPATSIERHPACFREGALERHLGHCSLAEQYLCGLARLLMTKEAFN